MAFKMQSRFAVSARTPFIALAEDGTISTHSTLRPALKRAVALARKSGIAMVTHGSHQVALCHKQTVHSWRRARPFSNVQCEVLPEAKAALRVKAPTRGGRVLQALAGVLQARGRRKR